MKLLVAWITRLMFIPERVTLSGPIMPTYTTCGNCWEAVDPTSLAATVLRVAMKGLVNSE